MCFYIYNFYVNLIYTTIRVYVLEFANWLISTNLNCNIRIYIFFYTAITTYL